VRLRPPASSASFRRWLQQGSVTRHTELPGGSAHLRSAETEHIHDRNLTVT